MDYLNKLLEVLNPSYWWGSSSSTPANRFNQDQTEPSDGSDKHDIPVTQPAQTLVSAVQGGCDPVHSHTADLQIPSLDSQNSLPYPDEIGKVDKINIFVKCAGQTIEVDVFPLESISVLLNEACERTKKKPEKMHLVYEGDYMDVNKKVTDYGLRGGHIVRLIPT